MEYGEIVQNRFVIFLLVFVLLASALTVALSENIATRLSPIPSKMNFENDRHRLDRISATLIHLEFERLASPRPTGTMVEGLFIPPASLPPITFDGMEQSDVDRAQASLVSREENADRVRDSALRARASLSENILLVAVGACFLALVALVIVVWARPFQQWKKSRSHPPRRVSAVAGIRGAVEKVGFVWGLFERVAAPLRQAFLRGREKVRSRDPDAR